jgi:hypothetical protein
MEQAGAKGSANADSGDGAVSLPSISLPTFDGITFERILTGGVDQPLFIDLDTGRAMTPPFELAPDDRGRSISLPNLSWTPQLRRWVRAQGIDAAAQTDGREVTFVGLEMRTAEPFPEAVESSTLTPAAILKRIGEARPQAENRWVTFMQIIGPGRFGSRRPFVTREDGVGWVSIFGFAEPSLRGPNSVMLEYQIVRGFKIQDEGEVDPVGRGSVPESPILGEFAGFLILDVQDEKLALRLPGSLHQIEVGKGMLAVRERGVVALEAARLYTGYLDIDARRNLVKVHGRGAAATFRRVGRRIHVSMEKRTAGAERVVLSMPEMRFFQDMKWEHE